VADVLTGGRLAGGVGDTTRVLVGMRRSLARNSAGRSGTQLAGAGIGTILAVGTLLLGLVRFDDQGRSVDLLAALLLGWLIGWVMGPVALRGGGQGLRPEWFALLPIPPRRLAAGLLGASFMAVAPVITLVAFSAVVVTAARWGVAPVLVAIPGVLLELVVVVLLSRVAIAALTATLNSRRGQELGGLLMAVVIAIASGGWSLAAVMAQQLAAGSPPAASTALRVLPSGWAPVAVAAADRSDWVLAAGALLGLVALAGLLLLAWAALLQRNMRKGGGRTARVGRRWAGRQAGQFGLLPASPTGAVVGKELRAWRRDAERTQTLLLALLVSVLNLAVPALAWGARSLLLWVGLVAAVLASLRAGNSYGDDGTALWLTRMTPGTERADVRGRQAAWLLAVAPVMVVLTVALTAFSGEGWAWPLAGAALPAVLAGTAGLGVLVSVAWPIRQKDPNRRTSPFDPSDDPNASGAAVGRGYLMLGLAALTAVPGGTLVLLGTARHQPALQSAGVLAGIATGALLYWWGGSVASRRLADQGAELMDLLRVGPQAAAGAKPVREPEVRLPPAAAAARGALWTAGILCIAPQGVVPIAFNLFGVDPQVKVWFAARYLPQQWQVPAAIGFIALGLLLVWGAVSLTRRYAGQP
jgi:ABC-2 type transport system permease protein